MRDETVTQEAVPPQGVATAPDPSVDAERRAAVAKLGILAAYTAPLMLASMTGVKAAPISRS